MEWGLVQQTIAATAQDIYKTFAEIATQPVATYASGLGSCVTKFVTHNPDPVASITSTVLLMTILHFILGNLTGNSSWVDKSWSVLPVYYSWKLWLMAPGPASDPRAAILSGLLAVWGLRLTYNFYRKGGYAWKGEDYR
jgi:steroid 5-alpha reductase family enzyme